MKNLFNNIPSVEKERILEMHRSAKTVFSEQTSTSKTIIGTNLSDFSAKTRTQTVGQGILTGPADISIDLDKLTLRYKVDPQVTPVTRLSLAYSDVNLPCESCTNIKKENNGIGNNHFAKEIVNGSFENGTRQFMLFAIYPPKSPAI